MGFDTDLMTVWHWTGVLLTGVTGAIHLYLYVQQEFVPFLFAGVVFFGAVLAVLLNVYRRVLYVLGVPFVAGQIASWYALGMPDMSIAVVDKPVQAVLILLLVYLYTIEGRVQNRARR